MIVIVFSESEGTNIRCQKMPRLPDKKCADKLIAVLPINLPYIFLILQVFHVGLIYLCNTIDYVKQQKIPKL